MAKTLEQILQEQLGALLFQQAALLAENGALKEENAALKAAAQPAIPGA